jgi:hypothetical protein
MYSRNTYFILAILIAAMTAFKFKKLAPLRKELLPLFSY